MEEFQERLLEEIGILSQELEKLRMLREHELGVHVHVYPSGQFWVEEGGFEIIDER